MKTRRPKGSQGDDWPLKAYKNLDFLNSHEARKIRVLCEMTEPEVRFQEENIEDTIVMFGSARIEHPDTAEAQLAAAKARIGTQKNPAPELKKALRLAETRVRSARFYAEAMELAHRLTRWSMELPDKRKRFIICSGGGPGIMEAANRGAREAGGASIGLGISLPFEQGVNDYITRDLKFEFHYFFIRKYWFMYMAKALIAFPGGFGTLDELFETLTLVQTRKVTKSLPILLHGKEFWNTVVDFEELVYWGVISPEDLDLFLITDSVDEGFDFITQALKREHLPHLC